MLSDRPDAQELLDLLGFESADWRQYYQDLWARYPTLSEDWVHVGFLNLPKRRVVDKRESNRFKRWQAAAAERDQRDLLMVAEIRAKSKALLVLRGPARAKRQKMLDRRLAELGLRPSFRGGTSIPQRERPGLRKRYDELRALLDEVRDAGKLGEETDPQYRLALLIRFPLLTEEEIEIASSHPYKRRGTTSKAAMAILARRFNTPPTTLDRYLFPR